MLAKNALCSLHGFILPTSGSDAHSDGTLIQKPAHTYTQGDIWLNAWAPCGLVRLAIVGRQTCRDGASQAEERQVQRP